ncbi:hypothetical protein GGI35DRAFT_464844 [Trichoderma velutinum]
MRQQPILGRDSLNNAFHQPLLDDDEDDEKLFDGDEYGENWTLMKSIFEAKRRKDTKFLANPESIQPINWYLNGYNHHGLNEDEWKLMQEVLQEYSQQDCDYLVLPKAVLLMTKIINEYDTHGLSDVALKLWGKIYSTHRRIGQTSGVRQLSLEAVRLMKRMENCGSNGVLKITVQCRSKNCDCQLVRIDMIPPSTDARDETVVKVKADDPSSATLAREFHTEKQGSQKRRTRQMRRTTKSASDCCTGAGQA